MEEALVSQQNSQRTPSFIQIDTQSSDSLEKTGIGGTDIKTMKMSNASKTPERHRSKHKDKIKELELN